MIVGVSAAEVRDGARTGTASAAAAIVGATSQALAVAVAATGAVASVPARPGVGAYDRAATRATAATGSSWAGVREAGTSDGVTATAASAPEAPGLRDSARPGTAGSVRGAPRVASAPAGAIRPAPAGAP
ncbi:hypothetical protein OG764_22965 [Streptomyces sp. NBC_00239]